MRAPLWQSIPLGILAAAAIVMVIRELWRNWNNDV